MKHHYEAVNEVWKEKEMNMNKGDLKKLAALKSFPERARYLFEENWKGSNSSFYHRFNIGKTTFYDVMNDKKPRYSDYIIELFARAFGVSIDFLKKGGSEKGYYKPKMLRPRKLEEDATPYGLTNVRKRKQTTVAYGKADFEIRLNSKEEVTEITVKINNEDLHD